MSILTRYLLSIWLRMVVLCLGAFMTIYLVVDMMERMPRFFRAGGQLPDIVQYFFWKLPEMFGQVTPFSVLMGTILMLVLLARDAEMTALMSCGVSLQRISLPLLVSTVFISLALMLNAEVVRPFSSQKMTFVEQVRIKKKESAVVFRKNNIWFRSDPYILQARTFNAQAKSLEGVTLWRLDNSMNPIERIDGELARLAGDSWQLERVTRRTFTGGHVGEEQHQATMPLSLELQLDDLRVLDKNADNMSFTALAEYADNLSKSGYRVHRYLTMMHGKIASPFGACVMVLLALPFAIANSRSGGVALGVGASVGLGFAYFVVNAVLMSYGSSGVLPPVLGAWGANIIFAGIGMGLMVMKKG